MKLNGIKVIGSALDSENLLYEADLMGPTAIVMGSEGRGISREILKVLDSTFKIPQVGTTDSFNVSVATGIILYEALRQNQVALK